MGRRVSPTLIGAFVLVGTALAVAALVVFGSGKFFHHKYRFVLYFEGSVNGLNIGAPVKFKGVEIGSVSQVLLDFENPSRDFRIPVIIQLDADKLDQLGSNADFDDPRVMKTAIEHGLRGQLATQSLVTGLQFVELDFHPETPVRFY